MTIMLPGTKTTSQIIHAESTITPLNFHVSGNISYTVYLHIKYFLAKARYNDTVHSLHRSYCVMYVFVGVTTLFTRCENGSHQRILSCYLISAKN